MTPIQVRLAVAAGVVILLAFFVVPDFWQETDAPLQPGGQMIFGVTETAPSSAKAYPLRIMLHKRPAGFLEIQVQNEHGERLLRVDRKLRPFDPTDNIEFPLAMGGVLEPGAVWIPSNEREIGWLSAAGFVRKVVKYNAFKALEVEGAEGGVRYFELETGLLVGFEVQIGNREIVGTLMRLL